MKNIKTKFYEIGGNNKTYIIAEIGSNHNNNFDLACELIEKAKEAGVNAVKFQTFKASKHYSKKTPNISLYKEPIYNLIEKLEIDRTWHFRLSKLCDQLKIDFLDSPCDEEAISIAVSIAMPLIKISSFDMVDVRLVEKIAKTQRGIIISTGMANMIEIQNAINICKKNDNDKIIVLQCTSIYPAPPHLVNLKAIETIREAFGVITGFSDHTLGDHIACSSILFGAKVIEKHFTLNRNFEGPDHVSAIEPCELKDMVQKIREIELSIGNGIKDGPAVEEMELYKKARRSIIAAKNIRKGKLIEEEDIIIKRPGLGIHPSMLNSVLGKKAAVDIEEDDPITWEYLDN